jgi:hypothetical protein
MAKINIISGIQLSNNPRVVKEADALTEAGHEVAVFSSILNPVDAPLETALSKNKDWTLIPVIDNSIQSFWQRLRWFGARFRCRVWNKIYTASGWGNVRQLGYVGPELLELCRRRKADLNIVHLEQALWVGHQLLKEGERVAIDLEDWYSEDLSSKDRKSRPSYLLRRWEKRLLQGGSYATTTSHVLGSALSEAYKCPPPKVVYNTFSKYERDSLDGKAIDRTDRKTPSIVWFSQTVGPERGLEILVDALPKIQIPVQIHIRGRCRPGYEDNLRSRMPHNSKHKIFFHPCVPHRELLSRLAEHDIGFAGELSHCRSRDLTITNKIFQYLLAGLVVLASNTAGQKEISDAHPNLLHTFQGDSATSLASILNQIIADQSRIQTDKQEAIKLAETKYCWEESKNILLSSVSDALAQ